MKEKPAIDIWFELENRCNLKCKFCYNYWKDGRQTAPDQLPASSLNQCLEKLLRKVDCRSITLSGGEPLLRNDFYELVEYISTRGIPMVLTSNGLLLDELTILRLKKLGVVTFEVPLHSMDPDTHNYLSGAKCFDESLNTILLLKQLHCNIVPVFVATKKNISHFISVLETCGLLGLNRIILNRVIPSGRAKIFADEMGIPTDSEMIEMLIGCSYLANEKNIKIHLGVPIDLKQIRNKLDYIVPASCPVQLAQSRWTIDSGGNLRRCNHSSLSIGSLLDGGEDKLLEELLAFNHKCSNSYHPCQFIETSDSYITPVNLAHM